MASGTSVLADLGLPSQACWPADFPTGRPTRFPQDDHRLVSLAYLVPPSVITVATWYRNINLLSIAYAFRPRLRSRLTLSRLALLRNPWAFGGGVSHPSFVTRASILTSHTSTAARAAASPTWERSPTTPSKLEVRGFGS